MYERSFLVFRQGKSVSYIKSFINNNIRYLAKELQLQPETYYTYSMFFVNIITIKQYHTLFF